MREVTFDGDMLLVPRSFRTHLSKEFTVSLEWLKGEISKAENWLKMHPRSKYRSEDRRKSAGLEVWLTNWVRKAIRS
ncbi:MAG: hypothetical protein GY769_08020 [bacterium]|nr:hypothetical protein [bacterium]